MILPLPFLMTFPISCFSILFKIERLTLAEVYSFAGRFLIIKMITIRLPKLNVIQNFVPHCYAAITRNFRIIIFNEAILKEPKVIYIKEGKKQYKSNTLTKA